MCATSIACLNRFKTLTDLKISGGVRALAGGGGGSVYHFNHRPKVLEKCFLRSQLKVGLCKLVLLALVALDF